MFKWPFGKSGETKKEKEKEKTVYVIDESYSPHGLATWCYSVLKELSLFGPRPSLSDSSREFAEKLSSIFSSLGVESRTECFSGNRDGIAGLFRITPLFLAFSSAFLLLGLPYLSLLSVLFLLYAFYKNIVRGEDFIFSRKGDGKNVIGEINPTGDVGFTVMLSSHLDSAKVEEGIGLRKSSYLVIFSIAYFAVLSFFQILHEILVGSLFRFNVPSVISAIFIAFGILLTVLSFRVKEKGERYSPGVGDNLSGIAVTLAILKYFSKKKLRSVRVMASVFDGEEVGSLGAKAYFKGNEEKIDALINIDSIYSEDDLYLMKKDGFGFVQLDKKFSSELSSLLFGMGYKVKLQDPGYMFSTSDASASARAGIPSATISSIAPGVDNPSHSDDDVISAVSEYALERVIVMIMKYIEGKDNL